MSRSDTGHHGRTTAWASSFPAARWPCPARRAARAGASSTAPSCAGQGDDRGPGDAQAQARVAGHAEPPARPRSTARPRRDERARGDAPRGARPRCRSRSAGGPTSRRWCGGGGRRWRPARSARCGRSSSRRQTRSTSSPTGRSASKPPTSRRALDPGEQGGRGHERHPGPGPHPGGSGAEVERGAGGLVAGEPLGARSRGSTGTMRGRHDGDVGVGQVGEQAVEPDRAGARSRRRRRRRAAWSRPRRGRCSRAAPGPPRAARRITWTGAPVGVWSGTATGMGLASSTTTTAATGPMPANSSVRHLAPDGHHHGHVIGAERPLLGHGVDEAAVEQAPHQRGGGPAGRVRARRRGPGGRPRHRRR